MPGLDSLEFLVGKWKGRTQDQFGEKGVIESSMECARELDSRFIVLRGESTKGGAVLNSAVQYVAYDSRIERYVYKKMWSYGFIENGEGEWEDDRTLMFQISFDNPPPGFAGTQWRSFIRRYGADEIGHGLYTAKEGGDFTLYGETRQSRVSK
jgi:hypothetical protein